MTPLIYTCRFIKLTFILLYPIAISILNIRYNSGGGFNQIQPTIWPGLPNLSSNQSSLQLFKNSIPRHEVANLSFKADPSDIKWQFSTTIEKLIFDAYQFLCGSRLLQFAEDSYLGDKGIIIFLTVGLLFFTLLIMIWGFIAIRRKLKVEAFNYEDKRVQSLVRKLVREEVSRRAAEYENRYSVLLHNFKALEKQLEDLSQTIDEQYSKFAELVVSVTSRYKVQVTDIIAEFRDLKLTNDSHFDKIDQLRRKITDLQSDVSMADSCEIPAPTVKSIDELRDLL